MIATVNYNAQGGTGNQGIGKGQPGHEKTGKKLGHRRVGDDGFVTYKRFETSQLIGSIQLGLEYVFTNEANFPDRDLLYTVCNYLCTCTICNLKYLVFSNY